MQRKLHISSTLSLPLSAVTETFAVLAKRGMGKTYTAAVMAEEMLKVGAQCVIADPVGVWWGLRVSSDGKSPGLPIIVMGGEHGDIPLDETTGAIVAEFIVDTGSSVVLDLGLLRKNAMVRFMTDFAEKLYHAKGPEAKRSPLHLFLDEADAFAPQKPQHGQERLLGAMQDLVRRGRARGVGVTMITQRSAVLNKDVLTQAEVLVPLRTISPQDRKAIEDWIDIHADKSEADTVLESLPSLPRGTAWFWSPGWLDICQKVDVRKRETFDSSSTPEFGKTYKNIKLAPVDLELLKGKMAATIEKAKQDDPRLLRQEIAELRKQLSKRPTEQRIVEKPKVIEKLVPKLIPIPSVPGFVLPGLQTVLRHFDNTKQEMEKLLKNVNGTREQQDQLMKNARLAGKLAGKSDAVSAPAPALVMKPRSDGVTTMATRAIESRDRSESNGKLRSGAERILAALVQWHPEGMFEGQMRSHAGMKNSGTFRTYKSDLRTAGYIETRGDLLFATQAGLDYFGGNVPSSPQSTEEVMAVWRPKLRDGAKRILDVLVAKGGEDMTLEEVQESSGMTNSGTFRNYLSDLRTARLIVTGRGMAAANRETLFL